MKIRINRLCGVFAIIPTALALEFAPLKAQNSSVIAPGTLWNAMEGVERTSYITGLINGAVLAQAAADNYFDEAVADGLLVGSQAQSVRIGVAEAIQVFSDLRVAQIEPLVNTMSQMYSDPANACISFAAMSVFAVQRLRGTLPDALLSTRLSEARRRSTC